MKILLTIFICSWWTFSFSQKNNTNRFDSLGIKQGCWIEYDSLAVEGFSVSEQILKDSLGRTDRQHFFKTKFKRIKHVGFYNNGNKNGVWNLFIGKTLWMRVSYNNGDRERIEVLFPNGKPLYIAEKVDNENFLVKEYSMGGSLLKEVYKRVEFVKSVEEYKLYTIGF